MIISGGIDVFKAEFELLTSLLNERGVAAFTYDMLSTGETTKLVLTPTYIEYHLALRDMLSKHDLIDPEHIGVYGQSYGGNPVAMLAFDHDDKFSAAVVACGPVELPFLAFEPETLPFGVEPMTLEILEQRFRTGTCDPSDAGQLECAKIVEALPGFAVSNSTTSQSIDIPLLVQSPENDPFMPQPDIDLLMESAEDSTRLVTGLNMHCSRDRNQFWPQTADWISDNI